MKMAIVLGTRPEIIKLAPIIRLAKKEHIDHVIIHTEQHYDTELSQKFFDELQIRNPDFVLHIGSGTHGQQTGKALMKLEEIFMNINPTVVLVQGDTNSALSSALAAVKLHIPIGHVEAGLRSYDLRMPEEHNRRLIDHISNYLFAPTKENYQILQNENVWGNLYITGNTVIDACLQHYEMAKKLSRIRGIIKFSDFVLCTAHRTENIDNLEILNEIVKILVDFPDNIIFPMHPHTKFQLEKNNLMAELHQNHIQILPSVGYLDLLWLLDRCMYVISDSGGIQEEATAPVFNKFVFVLRDKTDRNESVESGFTEIVGTESKKVIEKIKMTRRKILDLPKKPSPYGNGNAAQKIIKILKNELG